MSKELNILCAIVLIIAIILSLTVGGVKASDPSTYSYAMEALDENRTTVMGLTASAVGVSAAVSLIPGDTCTPIADKISDYSNYLLLILLFTVLEKYLLTTLGAVSFYVIIPVGLAILLVDRFFPARMLKNIGTKLSAFGLILALIVPASVWVSDMISQTHQESIQETIQAADQMSGEISGSQEDAEEESDSSRNIFSGLTGYVSRLLEKLKDLLDRFIEAVVVMLVTACLVPILVIVFFIWVVKALFGIQLPSVDRMAASIGKARRSLKRGETDDDG